MVDMTAKIIPLPVSFPSKRISVVVVSYYTGAALFECLQAVLADPDVFELILVDNGNPESTRERLWSFANKRARVRILQGQGNVGFGRACNYGAKIAKGEYILFLNPDAIIEKGAVLKMAEHSDLLQNPSIVGGYLQTIHGTEQRGSRRRALTPWSAFVSFTPLHKLPGFRSIHMDIQDDTAMPQSVTTVSGACMLMDRQSFEMLGGFDERYFLHVEDIDVCRRAGTAGGQVLSIPTAKVMHYGSTSEVRIQRVEYEKFKGFIRYFWDYSPKWWAKVLLFFAAPFMFLAIMGRAWWVALATVWRD